MCLSNKQPLLFRQFFFRIFLLFTLPSFLFAQDNSAYFPIKDAHFKKQDLELFRIYTGYGPEDFVVDESDPNEVRFIIACTKRNGTKQKDGGIWYYAINSKERQAKAFTYKDFDPSTIRPHGIHLVKEAEGQMLYIISHEESIEKILKFEVNETELIYKAEWTSKDFPILKGPNDLFVNQEGDIYFSNHSNFVAHYLFKKKSGYIGFISRDRKTAKILVDKLNFPNGVFIKEDQLFVSTTSGKALYEYQMMDTDKVAPNSQKKRAKVKGGDNIMLWKDQLLIAHHPKTTKFLLHAIFGSKSTSAITAYNLSTKESQLLLCSKGRLISGSSTAVIHGDFLYVSQVFDNYIVKIPLSEGQQSILLP